MNRDQAWIASHIPHRPPFLWLDRVLHLCADSIVAEKKIEEDLDLFRGHYPGHPIMPGVLLCEAVFQAGALLVSSLGSQDGNTVPVLTRILGAKFKRQVHPGDRIEIQVRLRERLGPAWILDGSVRLDGKLALKVEFAVARARREAEQ